MYEYQVVSKWTGWFGGWGSESNIAQTMNEAAGDGWRLVRSENALFAWWWFYPRRKVLLVFERERQAAPIESAP